MEVLDQDRDRESDIIFLGEDEIPVNEVSINDVTFQFDCGENSLPGTSHQGNEFIDLEPFGELLCDGEEIVGVGEEEEEEEDNISWAYIPDVILAKIASNLSQWDKSEMSLVSNSQIIRFYFLLLLLHQFLFQFKKK